jgi:hypothetical protein
MANLPEESVWTDGIYQLEEDDPVRGGPEGVSNTQAKQLACRTAALKEAAGEAVSRLNALEGRGGPVAAHDFGTETPPQEDLTAYACRSIWGVGGAFVWNGGDPAASTYTVGGAVHAAVEIFNATWVRNTYNGTNHRVVLTNTPDTSPPVFSWEDVGYDTVGVATAALAGLVKSGGDIEVNPATGGVTVKNADKLDGQEGSYYQNAGNMNAGTLPAARLPARTGDVTSAAGSAALTLVAAKVLEKLLTVDGASSGLDADKLDGQEGSYYQNAGNMNAGTLPAARLGNAAIKSGDAIVGVSGVEFSGVSSSAGHGGHLDFRYNGSSADYTSRVIEEASGAIAVYASSLAISGALLPRTNPTAGTISISLELSYTPPRGWYTFSAGGVYFGDFIGGPYSGYLSILYPKTLYSGTTTVHYRKF